MMSPDERINPLEESPPVPDQTEEQRRLVSRRALVRAGWIVPVVLALPIPVSAFAQYACAHTDVPASAHTDVPASAHIDSTVLSRHSDVPATLHTDVGGAAHTDACA